MFQSVTVRESNEWERSYPTNAADDQPDQQRHHNNVTTKRAVLTLCAKPGLGCEVQCCDDTPSPAEPPIEQATPVPCMLQ